MSVVAALTDLKKYSQKKKPANISNWVFRMHKFTCAFLLCCSALTTSKQFFGSNIHCMLGSSDVPTALFESYCFMKSTFTHAHSYHPNRTVHSNGHSQPGISTGAVGASGAEKDSIHHNYYQWVCLLLVVQAAMCYLPWQWWKLVERGRVGRLVEKVNKDPLTETPVEEQVAGLARFLGSHSKYFDSCAIKLLLGQSLCLILTIVQLYLMDIILDNQFLHLGTNIWTSWSVLDRALETIFPITVTCTMNYHGPSGDVTHVSGLCTLPINIVNEKIYLVIWVWYITMIILTVLLLLGKILLLLSPYLRQVFIQREAKQVPGTLLRRLIRHSSYGDYILLSILAKNLDTTQFSALISHLCDNISLVSSRAQINSALDSSYSSPEKHFRSRMMNKEV